MDRKVKQDQVLDRFERGPSYPGMIPMNRKVSGKRNAYLALLDRFSSGIEMGRKTAILIHRERHTIAIGQIAKFLSNRQVGSEGLLTQDMSLCLDTVAEDGNPFLGMRRHIEDRSIFACQELPVILVNPGLGEKLIPTCFGPFEIEVAKSRNLPAGISVGTQMMFRDPSANRSWRWDTGSWLGAKTLWKAVVRIWS